MRKCGSSFAPPFQGFLLWTGFPRVSLRSTLGCSAVPFQGLNRVLPFGRLPDTTRSAGGAFIQIYCAASFIEF